MAWYGDQRVRAPWRCSCNLRQKIPGRVPRRREQEMAHLIVQGAATHTAAGTVIVLAVSGSEDGLARTGLALADFVVFQVPDIDHAVPAPRPVDRLLEGPEGCYCLMLAPSAVERDGRAAREVFSVAVHSPTHGGWADEHGLAVAAT